MQIKAVIRYLGVYRVMHDTSFSTLSDVLGSSDGRTSIILCCEDDTQAIKYYDFSALIADQPVWCNDVRDWASLKVYLTNLQKTILSKFEVHCVVPEFLIAKDGNSFKLKPNTFLSDQSKQLRILSLDNVQGVTIHMGYHKYPGMLDKQPLAHTLNDVVIESSLGTGKLNLNNAIPVINGVVCYPCFDVDNRMYAVNGKFFLKKKNPITTNSLLIDFSALGDLQTVKLSDCELVSIIGLDTDKTIENSIIKGGNILYNSQGQKIRDLKPTACDTFVGVSHDAAHYKTSDIQITFLLPEGVIGVPIVSIFGRLFTTMYDKVNYQIEENRIRIILTVKRDLIYRILGTNMVKTGQIIKNSPVYQAYLKDNLEGLFEDKDEFLKDYYESYVIDTLRRHRDLRDLSVPFVAVVSTTRKFHMNFQPPKFKIDNENLMFKVNSGGILFNRETLEIVDYVRVPFYNGTLCTFYHQDPFYDTLNDNLNEACIETSYYHDKQSMPRTRVTMKDLHDTSNLVLMDFFYETEPGEVVTPDIEPIPTPGEDDPGEYVDLNPAELLIGYDKLIAGARANVVIVQKSSDTLNITGVLPELCGDYVAQSIEPEISEQIWYLKEVNGYKTDWCIYMKNNFWMIGDQKFDPIYQSSDAGRGIRPWYEGYLAWFVGDKVNLNPEDDKTLSFKYISLTTLEVPTGRGNVTGTYTLLNANAKFIERVWCSSRNNLIFYDDTKNCWVVSKDAVIGINPEGVEPHAYVIRYGTRVYESSTAMHGSSPWHHLAYAYLLEE